MVETMAGSTAFLIAMIGLISGYLACSTIVVEDLRQEMEDLKNDYNNLKKEKEFLESHTNHYRYRDIA